ncbi:MAG TPA: N-acetylmuramoyl-L-alanine amidase [Gaiellaceae bacterium]|nr:N-acetylmuramoyl-L-alanine amidase [Gaiellaceae bacterium]
MRRLVLALLVVVSAIVLAPKALAGSPASITAVDMPLAGQRVLADASATHRFTLVGVHWRGSGTVRFRTRSVSGQWSPWRTAAPEADDAPDAGSAEGRATAGWRIGNPFWVGDSDRIETRTVGRVSRIRAYLVWSPVTRVPYRAPAQAGMPPIVLRQAWGADESIRRAPPQYASSVRFAIVHHTAGQNDYTRSQAPAIVRGIELYHVQGNGWNDIGYNFLVDRFGTVYEGRYGGIDRNVIGAHALGFNTGSVGVAVLGTYGSRAPSQAAQDALEKLLAWRLDVAHVNPLGLLTVISGGSERYAKGIPVTLRAISGHRDTGFTECPGTALYARLDGIAAAAASIGGPKIYGPRVDVNEVGARFRATLSTSLSWTVSITSPTGAEVARGTGIGKGVDWTWDASGLPAATYSWSIRAGTARPATGKLRAGGNAPALAIEEPSANPAAISPNGDQQADTSLVSFTLSIPANVSVEVVSAEGAVVATVIDRVFMGAGLHQVTVDGSVLPDGDYTVLVSARTGAGESVEASVPLAVSRTLGTVSVAPAAFSPNGDGRLDRLTIDFTLANPADVRIRIVRDDGTWVATPIVTESLPLGPQRFTWDGSRLGGGIVHDGSYEAVVDVTDAVGTVSFATPFVSDTTAPVVRLLPGTPLRVSVSEPAVLTMLIDGHTLRRVVKTAGTVRIPWSGPAKRVRVVAWDVAGNKSAPVLRVAGPGSRRPGQ